MSTNRQRNVVRIPSPVIRFESIIWSRQHISFWNSPSKKPVGNDSYDGSFEPKEKLKAISEEEKKIRTNPAAQVTSLLKEVFGGGKK